LKNRQSNVSTWIPGIWCALLCVTLHCVLSLKASADHETLIRLHQLSRYGGVDLRFYPLVPLAATAAAPATVAAAENRLADPSLCEVTERQDPGAVDCRTSASAAAQRPATTAAAAPTPAARSTDSQTVPVVRGTTRTPLRWTPAFLRTAVHSGN
jgi:hypothetical protein